MKFRSEQNTNDILENILADDCFAFRWAAANGHIEILEYLTNLAPNQISNMYQARRNYAWRQAVKFNHLAMQQYLKSLQARLNLEQQAHDSYNRWYFYFLTSNHLFLKK